MALFLGQDLMRIEQMPPSRIQRLYESETFKAWKQSRDASMKLPGIIVGRLDNLSKQLSGLGKQLSGRRG